MALARYSDNEKYPQMCPFRNSSVCSADYIPDSEYPGLLGTIRICPGPPRYTVAIPVPLGIPKIPEVLEKGDFGRLSYEIKRNLPDDENALAKFQEMEQRFWKEYLENTAKARELLKQNDQEAFQNQIQTLFDKQVEEAFALLKSLLPPAQP